MSDRPDQHASAFETVCNLFQQPGIAPEHLLAEPVRASVVAPTFDEYVPHVAIAVSPGTRRVCAACWQRICAAGASGGSPSRHPMRDGAMTGISSPLGANGIA